MKVVCWLFLVAIAIGWAYHIWVYPVTICSQIFEPSPALRAKILYGEWHYDVDDDLTIRPCVVYLTYHTIRFRELSIDKKWTRPSNFDIEAEWKKLVLPILGSLGAGISLIVASHSWGRKETMKAGPPVAGE